MPPSKLHCRGLFGALHLYRGTTCIVLTRQEDFFHNYITPYIKNASPPHALVRYLSEESVVAGLEKLKVIITIREIACTHGISICHDRLLEQIPPTSGHGETYHCTNPYWLLLFTPPSSVTGEKFRLQRSLSSVTSRKLTSQEFQD